MKVSKTDITKIFLHAIMSMTVASCSRNSCPIVAGTNTYETRSLSSFKKIILYDKINLILTQDSVQKITVQGDKNLLPGIHTVVTDSILVVQNKNGCAWLRNPDYSINVYVSSNLLQYISYYGSGNISSTNTLKSFQFTVDSWYGTGSITLKVNTGQANAYIRNNNASITLSGQATNTSVYCADVGSVDLIDFISTNVFIEQKSVRDVYVNATGTLKANIVYIGNLYYKGTPSTIDTLITNSGRLIHL